VIIIEENDETFEQELVSSVLEIITVFSSKLYGKRSHKIRKQNYRLHKINKIVDFILLL
jgi:predicted site-specific integrase-resolvase